MVQSCCGPSMFFNTTNFCSLIQRFICRLISISTLFHISAQSALAMCWCISSRKMSHSFQNSSSERAGWSISIEFCAENIMCFILEFVHGTQCRNAPPPQRIIAYVCMNSRYAQSFSKLYSYESMVASAGGTDRELAAPQFAPVSQKGGRIQYYSILNIFKLKLSYFIMFYNVL